ncbi:MAG: helix-turn-helix domain-containing protein [Candidatus Bathyarchaeum sp.]|nr:MAG: helix-turn-helix domain-containing protein [Candidatus Bathyarchaeum sp.]
MKRSEILGATERILEKAGFQLSKRCSSRSSCFDLAAQGHKQLIFLKICADIGNACLNDAAELQKISGCFSAIPLIIGEKTRKKPLEDDTVYTRYEICVITARTLEDMVLRGAHPLVEAGPGGYYIKLDGNLIKKRRQELGLSVGKLAEMVGISRRTLYGYERGLAKASVPAAYRLEWILGAPVVQNADVFQAPDRICFIATAKRIVSKHHLLKAVFRKFAQFNFKVTCIGRAPFDFIARCPKNEMKIIGGVANEGERNLDQRIKETTSLGEIIGAHAVFIVHGERTQSRSFPLIRPKVLEKMKCPEELFAQL